MKVTRYFEATRSRPDRARIAEEWIMRVIQNPEYETKQSDGRVRKWARIDEAGNRYLRAYDSTWALAHSGSESTCGVIVLEDGQTVHNAFFDRGFKP
jgi:hypothetical protein